MIQTRRYRRPSSNLCSTQSTTFSSELTDGLNKPFRNFVGDMLFGIEASPEVKLGKPKTVSITAHFKERLNSITGALACSMPTVC
jgi:hypothetical protein